MLDKPSDLFKKYGIDLAKMYENADDCSKTHPNGDGAPSVEGLGAAGGVKSGPAGYPGCFFNIPLCKLGSAPGDPGCPAKP